MEQRKVNIITITGKITDLRMFGSEISIIGRPKTLSLNYYITLDNKQKVEMYCSYFLNIKKFDIIEVTGEHYECGTLYANKIKLIKKYLPPQRRIGDFEK